MALKLVCVLATVFVAVVLAEPVDKEEVLIQLDALENRGEHAILHMTLAKSNYVKLAEMINENYPKATACIKPLIQEYDRDMDELIDRTQKPFVDRTIAIRNSIALDTANLNAVWNEVKPGGSLESELVTLESAHTEITDSAYDLIHDIHECIEH